MRTATKLGLVFAIVCLTLAGCSTPASQSPPATSTTTSTPTNSSTTTTTAPTQSGQSAFTGIGATPAEMAAVHKVDVGPGNFCSIRGSCFGASIKNSEVGSTYRFTGVTTDFGVVTGFSENFPTDTPLSVVRKDILDWMPKGTTFSKVTIDHNNGTCGFVNMSGSTLDQLFGQSKFQDPKGIVGAELSYVNTSSNDEVYDPNNIQTAEIMATAGNTSAACG